MLLVDKIATPAGDLPAFSIKGAERLSTQNWVEAKGVRTRFQILHDGNHIFIRFEVSEPQVRAVNTGYHSPVWEDSCVEFFFSVKGDGDRYYNFEFNAIGTILAAYGKDRHNRTPLSGDLLDRIVTRPSLGRKPLGIIEGPVQWELQVSIPREVLTHTPLNDLSGTDGYANFYKCGDKLDHPHYLSWNPALTETPDFHTPRYFRHLSFI